MAGRPMLEWLFERLGNATRIHDVIVATSDECMDDAIAACCAKNDVACFRGSLNNVAERLAAAAEWLGAREFLRITGDSPLLLGSVVDEVAKLYEGGEVDLATNVQKRSFPRGLSAEAVRVSALRRAQTMMQLNEPEHVTAVFYRRAGDFRISNLASGQEWGSIQMSVDTEDDFLLAERMIIAANGQLDRLDVSALIELRRRCISEMDQ